MKQEVVRALLNRFNCQVGLARAADANDWQARIHPAHLAIQFQSRWCAGIKAQDSDIVCVRAEIRELRARSRCRQLHTVLWRGKCLPQTIRHPGAGVRR